MKESKQAQVSRKTRYLLLALLSIVLLGWAIFLLADIPNDVFELDGNAVPFNSTPPRDDWNLLNGTGTAGLTPGGAPGQSLVRTFVAGGPDIFTQGGSKDPL